MDDPLAAPRSGYRGRFAPSPTGPLHFGSLVTALASYLDTRRHDGEWLVRIDDVDRTRVRPGLDRRILRTLECFGFEWDGEISWQSATTDAYAEALEQLRKMKACYCCACSRKTIAARAVRRGSEGPVYPGTCRRLGLEDRPGRAIRLQVPDRIIDFDDATFGHQAQNLAQEVGDFVIRRADGCFAYQLAVVVDDGLAGITHVVRGADLLSSTPRQILLQQLLGLPTPHYRHIPLVLGKDGKKLSKREAADPVDESRPVDGLLAAWRFLDQPPPPGKPTLSEFWEWAPSMWDPRRFDRRTIDHVITEHTL